ncbi:MAG: hypothetical protein ACOCXA_02150, partial [Planctomycetota bacterium]
ISIYLQYNRYFPVRDARVPAADYYDHSLGTDAGILMNRLHAAGGRSIPLGIEPEEVLSFTEEDFHYSWKRQSALTSRLVNDVRMSLFGAGRPETMSSFAGAQGAWMGSLVFRSPLAGQVGIAGRNQAAGGQPRPFSRTGRLVMEPNRFYRLLIRGQLINLTIPYEDHREQTIENFLDVIYCVDPDENGDMSDARILSQRRMGSSKVMKNL